MANIQSEMGCSKASGVPTVLSETVLSNVSLSFFFIFRPKKENMNSVNSGQLIARHGSKHSQNMDFKLIDGL